MTRPTLRDLEHHAAFLERHIDEHGRAVLETPEGEKAISAGDLFLA